MSAEDRERWDARHRQRQTDERVGPPAAFAGFVDHFLSSGHALELACGRGAVTVWLAHRGLHVHAVDVSPVAIAAGERLAAATRMTGRCRFTVADLDDGLPDGPPVDVLMCTRFRDPRLDPAMLTRVAPGGVLALTALSEVGARAGRFRPAADELARAFDGLEVITAGQRDGLAWLLARR